MFTQRVLFSPQDFCSRLRNLSAAEVDKLKIRRNAVTNELEIECFVDRINAYMQVRGTNSRWVEQTVVVIMVLRL